MADEVRCESCGDILLEGGRVCTTCKAQGTSVNHCVTCGKEMPEGDHICPECKRKYCL
jgi:RNA polymerase subunit RPABC4/transcription elongation factor Spt4